MVLMVVLVLGLEVLMNHIGLDEEDTVGSSVGSSDGINYEKKPVGLFLENLLGKGQDAEVGGISRWSMNLMIIQKMCSKLT